VDAGGGAVGTRSELEGCAMREYYRTATEAERQFYRQAVYPLQDRVFALMPVYGELVYLTGGTALSRFYFDHRLSEDIDFFVVTDDLKVLANDLAARLTAQGLEVTIERLDGYFSRFYVMTEPVRLKVEFAREFNLLGDLLPTPAGVLVNNLEDLGANKITAFEDRAEIKDIIDLYYITQQIPWERLFELADAKRVPVAYEQLLTINVRGIAGSAWLTTDIAEEKLLGFVTDLTARVEAEVKKKERTALNHIPAIVTKLLWDFPADRRTLNAYSMPVLRRRLKSLPLPERRALGGHIGEL